MSAPSPVSSLAAPLEQRARWGDLTQWFAALALGAAHAMSFAPWTLWWAQTLLLAAMLLLWWSSAPTHASQAPSSWPRRAALPFAFSLGWFTAGLCWLYISMHDYGGMPMPMAAAAVVLFAAYLAVFPCLAFVVSERLAGYRASDGFTSRLLAALVFAAAWTISEWLRGWLFTGFPWLATGYAHVDSPLAGWAPITGVFALSGLAALLSFLIGDLIMQIQRHRKALRPAVSAPTAAALTVLTALALLASGQALRAIEWSQPAGRPIKVRLLQGNVPQQLKFVPQESLRAMQNYARMVAQPGTQSELDMTVLPETAWTIPWPATDPILIEQMFPPGRANPKHAVISGMPMPVAGFADRSGHITNEMIQRGRIANSVVLLRGDRPGDVSLRYDKQHLVPFGEFIPWGFAWFVRMMEIPLGTFARGGAQQTPFSVADQRVAFNICYEDLFGEELAHSVTADGGRASILVNVSNIAWFGRSHALSQHLQIARLRAIELARPMLRSTNTGMTASIDSRGRVRAVLEHHVVGVLEDEVQGMQGDTPFARWTHKPALALAALILLAAGARRRRGSARKSATGA